VKAAEPPCAKLPGVIRCGVCAIALLLAGCGGAEDDSAGSEGGPAPIQAQLATDRAEDSELAFATSDYAIGVERVAFALVRKDGRVVEGKLATVQIAPGGLTERPTQRVPARFEPVGRQEEGGVAGLYVAHIRFDEPRRYGLLVETADNAIQGYATVDVKATSTSPAVGSKAPASNNPTLRDAPAKEITTARPPDISLLRYSIRDTLREKQPFVVVFATPAFCASRTCGPTVEVVEEVQRRVGDRARFIHVEVYEKNDPKLGVNRWMREWTLPTEPWVFVVDDRGIIRTKFEGTASVSELETAVRQVVD
jgi:hypothetical protein